MKKKGMQLMVGRLTTNVLGCLILFVALSACSIPQPVPIQIAASPVDRPELVLPRPDVIQTRTVDWVIITPDNVEEVFEKAKASGRPITFFALTENGYEALALNLNDLRTFIQQLQTIIVAYENYYAQSTAALDEANRRMKEQATAVNNR